MEKTKIGVLGATGMVGQAIVQLLSGHPWFELSEVAASERSAGQRYGEAMASRWSMGPEVPDAAAGLTVKECTPDLDCDLVLSALDSSVAGGIEERFAKAGYAVSSNARNHRMEPDVPLLIPEINSEHLQLIGAQRKRTGWKGFIVTDPNCSTIAMCLALAPLAERFGIEKVMVTTMQALSGAGYPGVASTDALDNVIPFISGEEEKMQSEPLKILGKVSPAGVKEPRIEISAQCNRVPVRNGHTECISVKLSKAASEKEVIKAFREFRPLKGNGLPSAPDPPLVYLDSDLRPQPRLDAWSYRGMAVSIGRLRRCSVLDYKFVALSNNLIRGAAGAALLNAELLKSRGYLDH